MHSSNARGDISYSHPHYPMHISLRDDVPYAWADHSILVFLLNGCIPYCGCSILSGIIPLMSELVRSQRYEPPGINIRHVRFVPVRTIVPDILSLSPKSPYHVMPPYICSSAFSRATGDDSMLACPTLEGVMATDPGNYAARSAPSNTRVLSRQASVPGSTAI